MSIDLMMPLFSGTLLYTLSQQLIKAHRVLRHVEQLLQLAKPELVQKLGGSKQVYESYKTPYTIMVGILSAAGAPLYSYLRPNLPVVSAWLTQFSFLAEGTTLKIVRSNQKIRKLSHLLLSQQKPHTSHKQLTSNLAETGSVSNGSHAYLLSCHSTQIIPSHIIKRRMARSIWQKIIKYISVLGGTARQGITSSQSSNADQTQAMTHLNRQGAVKNISQNDSLDVEPSNLEEKVVLDGIQAYVLGKFVKQSDLNSHAKHQQAIKGKTNLTDGATKQSQKLSDYDGVYVCEKPIVIGPTFESIKSYLKALREKKVVYFLVLLFLTLIATIWFIYFIFKPFRNTFSRLFPFLSNIFPRLFPKDIGSQATLNNKLLLQLSRLVVRSRICQRCSDKPVQILTDCGHLRSCSDCWKQGKCDDCGKYVSKWIRLYAC